MQNIVHEITDHDYNKLSLSPLTTCEENKQKNISEELAQVIKQLAALESLLHNQDERGSKIDNMQFSINCLTYELKKTQDDLSGHAKNLAANSIIGIIKQFFKPRLGTLYQHRARPAAIPKYYLDKPDLTRTPTISIVTPAFNQGKYIERTIKSILDQHYPTLEYIIQDGGSKDGTLAILEQYQSSLKHWQSAKDNGQSAAINKGFQHATGEIMAYINSDDILLPGTLHYVANYFEKHPEVDVVYGHRILIDEFDHEIGRWVLPPHNSKVISWADYIPQETLFWRRHIWDKSGGKIDESFKFAMDWDLVLRFIEAGANIVRLPRFLGAFRVHTEQKTIANISDTGIQEMRRIRQRCHGRQISYQEIKRNCGLYLMKHIILHRLYQIGIIRY